MPGQLSKKQRDLFQEFVSDSDFGRAKESFKRTNDIFDIISPGETQHSEILAWLFNPREGHGQGDAIFKDFLTAAWREKTKEGSTTSKFFESWTPARIGMTGFQSLIIHREFPLKSGRLDLFMVDPVNRIVVIVENKQGARVGDDQLQKYYKDVNSLLKAQGLTGYHTAFIVLDKKKPSAEDLVDDEEVTARVKIGTLDYWAYINYSWLEAGAQRADAQQKKGNQSASLVISYCNRQSGFESDEEYEFDTLMANLASRYRELKEPFREALDTNAICGEALSLKTHWSQFLVFVQSHDELIQKLLQVRPLAFVKAELQSRIPSSSVEIVVARKRLRMFDEDWSRFWHQEPDAHGNILWPLKIQVRDMRNSSDDAPTYRVMFELRRDFIKPELLQDVEQALGKLYPEMKNHSDANLRRLGQVVNVPPEELAFRIHAMYDRVAQELRNS